MINNTNTAILILSTNVQSYKVFIDAIKETWFLDAYNSGYKIFFYSGGHAKDEVYDNHEIRVTENDELSNCYRKFVAAKNVLTLNSPEVELIYRTNLSSFIDIENFSKYIKKACFTKNSYHGLQGKVNKFSLAFSQNSFSYFFLNFFRIGPVIKFYSGAGFFIGIDLANSLSFDSTKKYLIDDVEIGLQITNYTKHKIICPRVYLTGDYAKITLNVFEEMVKNELLFHYKFKTKDRIQDSFLLRKFIDSKFREDFLTKEYL